MNHGERSQILQMVESGQVTVQDAIGLMGSTHEASVAPEPIGTQRWLRIRVTDLETGRGKVNVNIPLSWMRLGLTLGACFVPELEGVDVDEVFTSLDQSTAGHIIQVEDAQDNQRVEVYVD